MSDEKRNRIIAAVTVNVIILIAVLAAVIIYQIVQIKIVSRNRQDIINQIEYYQEQTEINNDTLEFYKSKEGLIELAYKYGFAFGKK